MSTLIAISGLGFICLLLEIFNLRKSLIPVVLLGLIAILGFNITESLIGESFFDVDSYNMMRSSGYVRGFTMLFIILTIFVVLLSGKFYEDKKSRIADYISLKIFLLAGAVAMIAFGNFIMFFVGLEVLSVAAYILAGSNPLSIKSNEAGMKYFIMGAVASSFVLFGLALVYGSTASFDVITIQNLLASGTINTPLWLTLGVVMISVGMFFKASIFPFHFWSPDVYEGAPTVVTAMMSTLVKVASIGAFFYIASIFAPAVGDEFTIIIVVLSILTMTVGNITALRQTNIKRMMAYSGISHAGFMIMTLIAVPQAGSTILYYASAYSLAGIVTFAVILSVCRGKDNEDISNFYGLFARKPLLAVAMAGALMSLGGIPIFAGFFAKFFLFKEMLSIGQVVLVIAGVINSIIAIYYYFGVINVMFSKDSDEQEALKVPYEYTVVAVTALILILLIGIFPSIITSFNLS